MSPRAGVPGELQPRDTPDAVAPPPRHPRFPLIDGLRAVAVISVLLVHVAVFGDVGTSIPARLLLHLNIGVTLFFLISGFLLYRPFIAARGGGAAAPRVGDYAKRRFLRILPAYWLFVLVLALLPGIAAAAGGQLLRQLAMLQTLPLAEGPSCVELVADCGAAQTWSLAIELSFYAILPLYALLSDLLIRRLGARLWIRTDLLLLGALSALSIGIRFVVAPDSSGPVSVIGGTFVGFAFWFALGMALAVVSVHLSSTPREPELVRRIGERPEIPWLLAGAGYALLCLLLPPSPFFATPGEQLLTHVGFGVICLLVMLPAVFGDTLGGLPRRFLALRPVAWIGLISYGIFLWHLLVTQQLGSAGEGLAFLPLLALTLVIAIPAATCSYYLLERPLLKLKYRRLRLPRHARERPSPQ